jgi:hypothetical protein
MHTLIKTLPLRSLLLEQLPAITVAFVVAETFYKFHSFTLECLAFLATWYVFDFILSHLIKNRKEIET